MGLIVRGVSRRQFLIGIGAVGVIVSLAEPSVVSAGAAGTDIESSPVGRTVIGLL